MTTQYERDLRSANKEWKRTKDSAAKWSHGSRHLAGITVDWTGKLPDNVPDHQLAKFRPGKKPSEDRDHHLHKPTQNLIKCRAGHTTPASRRREKLYARGEVRDASLSSYLDSPLASPTANLTRSMSMTASDPFVYSFDRTESPGRPLTLEVFVKSGGGKAGKGDLTEKLVEKEYEVVDENGEAVRGRKARAFLRRGATTGAVVDGGTGGDGQGVEEDEGFELV